MNRIPVAKLKENAFGIQSYKTIVSHINGKRSQQRSTQMHSTSNSSLLNPFPANTKEDARAPSLINTTTDNHNEESGNKKRVDKSFEIKGKHNNTLKLKFEARLFNRYKTLKPNKQIISTVQPQNKRYGNITMILNKRKEAQKKRTVNKQRYKSEALIIPGHGYKHKKVISKLHKNLNRMMNLMESINANTKIMQDQTNEYHKLTKEVEFHEIYTNN